MPKNKSRLSSNWAQIKDSVGVKYTMVLFTRVSNVFKRACLISNMSLNAMGAIIMSSVKWESICLFCGKRHGGGMTRSESSGAPTTNPPMPSGKCPSSPDGKHKPRWEKR